MNPDEHRFGPPFATDSIIGEASEYSGELTLEDFRSGAFTPILVAGIYNPAGPTLTICSLCQPVEDGES